MSSLNQIMSPYSWSFAPPVRGQRPIWRWKQPALHPELTGSPTTTTSNPPAKYSSGGSLFIAKAASEKCSWAHRSSPATPLDVFIQTCQRSSNCISCVKQNQFSASATGGHYSLCIHLLWYCTCLQASAKNALFAYWFPGSRTNILCKWLWIFTVKPPNPRVTINHCLLNVLLRIYGAAVWAPAFPL